VKTLLFPAAILLACATLASTASATWTQIAKLGTPDGSGVSQVVASSDGSVVVGLSDLVYVWVKPSGGWSSTNSPNAYLGVNENWQYSNVAITPDGTIVVVTGFNVNTLDEKAFVFVMPSGGWSGAPSPTADLENSASYGYYPVAAVNSGNTIVVGASDWGEYNDLVLIYTEPSGGWATMTAPTASLTASDSCGTGDYFGSSVAMYGNAVVAGALGHCNTGTVEGAAYVYVKPSGGWTNMTQTAELTASDASSGDCFGGAVAMNSNTALIADWCAGSYTGEAYIFVEPSGGWANSTQTSILTASDAFAGNYFGGFADISFPTTLGLPTAVVAGDGGSAGYGAAYVYAPSGSTWPATMTQTAEIATPGTEGGPRAPGVAVKGTGTGEIVALCDPFYKYVWLYANE
jgi:hypothetical protein